MPMTALVVRHPTLIEAGVLKRSQTTSTQTAAGQVRCLLFEREYSVLNPRCVQPRVVAFRTGVNIPDIKV